MLYKDYTSIIAHNMLKTTNYHSAHGFSEPGLVIYCSSLLDPSSDGGAPNRFPLQPPHCTTENI